MIIIRIEHYEVSFLAHLDTTNAVRTVQSGRTVQGQSSDGLFNTHFHINARQGKCQGDGAGETTARIEVGGKGHGTTGINHFASTSIGFFQSKGCQRKKGRHNSLVGHGVDVRIRSMQQMVGRDGRKFSSQSGTP